MKEVEKEGHNEAFSLRADVHQDSKISAQEMAGIREIIRFFGLLKTGGKHF